MKRRRGKVYSFAQISEDWGTLFVPSGEELGSVESDTARPVWLFFLLTVAIFIILGVRLWQLTLVEGDHMRTLSDGNRIRKVSVAAVRGVIEDQHGAALVRNSPDYRLVVVPADLPKQSTAREALWQHLGALLHRNPTDLAAAGTKTSSFDPLVIADKLTQDEAVIVETSYSSLPGVSVDSVPVRDYLYGDLYSQVLGYTGQASEQELSTLDRQRYSPDDQIGKTGIEGQYETLLHGSDGAKQIEVDAAGRLVKTLGNLNPIAGDSIRLTIDDRLQRQMQASLQAMLQKSKATGAVGVALNPKDGAVLAYVSLPSFDPNLFAHGISDADYQNLINNPGHPLLDRVISGTYAPGSTIKPYIGAVALDAGTITPDTTINGPASIQVGGATFPDWRTQGPGINLQKAIAYSSDIYFYGVGGGFNIQGVGSIKGLGIERLASGLQQFAFGKTTGIDLPGETSGIIPTPEWKDSAKHEQWYLGDTYHASIGQGDLSVTPMQLVTSLASLANGGTLYEPHLLDQVRSGDKIIRQAKPKVIRQQVYPSQTLEIVRSGMRQAVTSGTARPLQDLPVEMAGKTGTAEYGIDNAHTHAWFECFGPYSDPSIAMVVMLEGGGESFDAAVPVANEILKAYFSP
jgi:penicillin-binding protein 2